MLGNLPVPRVGSSGLLRKVWLEGFGDTLVELIDGDDLLASVEESSVFDDEVMLDSFSGFNVTVYMIMAGISVWGETPEAVVFAELGEIKDNVKLAGTLDVAVCGPLA